MAEVSETGARDQVVGKDYGVPSDPLPQFASGAATLRETLDTFWFRELERGTTPVPPGLRRTRICDLLAQRPPTETH